MDKYKEVRPIVLGLARHGSKILVMEGHQLGHDETYYRCLGGGIGFQEKSPDTLVRKFKEEINVDIKVGEYLGMSENIFIHNGKKQHELVVFYDITIPHKDYQDEYQSHDGTKALWVEVDEFLGGVKIIYPCDMAKFLK